MRKVLFTAALVAAALPLSPAMAREMTGYTVRPTDILSGPADDYPAVRPLGPDARLMVYGCLSDWSWCDVSYADDRGWVSGDDIVVGYRGHRSRIMPYMGLGILAFSFGAYWDDHYRGRPFYADRARWQQNYTQNYRPAWGGGGGAPAGNQHQGSPVQGHAHQAPVMRAAPNGNQGAHQATPHYQHAAPVMRAAPAPRATPAEHGGGEQGHAHGGSSAERPQGNPGGEHRHGG